MIVITRYTGPGGAVSIPATIADLPVKSIGSGAFSECISLTNVTIPNSVTSIGIGAFYGCTSLTNVTIPDSVTSIEREAFGGCASLTAITVDPHNTAYSSVEGVLFDKSQNTLIQCPGGKAGSYVIPNSVTSIGSFVFYGCTGLTSVTIPNSVTSIGQETFSGCTSLTSVTIGESVTNIGEGAFRDCSSLMSITIPNSVTSIEYTTFAGCTRLASVTIGESVTNIGGGAFGGCTSLATITVDPQNTIYSSLEGVVFDKRQNTLFYYPPGKVGGSYVIPNSVTNIGWNAFEGCTSLTSVTIPDSVTSIGVEAFRDCTSLTSVTIPDSVTVIGCGAFEACNNLRSVYFLGSAPSITSFGLYSCHFQSILAPNVTVYYRAGTPGWGDTYMGRPTTLWIPPPAYAEWVRSTGLIDRYPNASGEADDADQDGLNNSAEMLAGTDPTDRGSVLVIENLPRLDDLTEEDKTPVETAQHSFFFRSVPGKIYGIQSADTLGGPWRVETTMTATTTQKRAVLEKPESQRFYRVVVVP